MAIHKITTDLYEDAFTLLALHSSLKDYAMVYAINLCLKTNFVRASKDLDISKNVSFSFFEWKDDSNDNYWTLLSNQSEIEESFDSGDLFENEPAITKHYLLPEYKEVDYLLKIEHEDDALEKEVLKQLLKIPNVLTAYILNIDHLKYKDNLIF